MGKLKKQHYVFIFLLAFVLGLILRGTEKEAFRIVENSTAYAPELVTATGDKTDSDVTKININEASAWELNELYGIGDRLAGRIIDYRSKNGKFETIEDIMKVSGIGEDVFNSIKNHIYVE